MMHVVTGLAPWAGMASILLVTPMGVTVTRKGSMFPIGSCAPAVLVCSRVRVPRPCTPTPLSLLLRHLMVPLGRRAPARVFPGTFLPVGLTVGVFIAAGGASFRLFC